MSRKILVIAEQQRLQRLFDSMAEASLRGVTVVASLTDAADQLEAELPDLILVQDRLSGLSGELIVRHLRNRLRDRETVIVLATDAADSLVVDDALLHLLDCSLPEQELTRQVERLVARLPLPVPAALAVPPAHSVADDEFMPLNLPGTVAEEAPAVVAAEPTASLDDHAPVVSAASSAEPVPEPPEVSGDTLESGVASRFEAELETELARHEAAPGPETPAGVEPTLSVNDMLTVAASEPRRFSKGVLALFGGLGLVLVVALVLLQLPDTPPKGVPAKPAKKAQPPVVAPAASPAKTPASTAPAAAPPTPAPTPAVTVAPPKFVSSLKAALDPAYGRDHAGWERYLTPGVEFKLFRERGKLQALQVVDREGGGIPTSLFSRAMEELTGVRDYQTEAREIKGAYLVKKGRLATGSRIIIYKDRQDEQLHGFVIYFD